MLVQSPDGAAETSGSGSWVLVGAAASVGEGVARGACQILSGDGVATGDGEGEAFRAGPTEAVATVEGLDPLGLAPTQPTRPTVTSNTATARPLPNRMDALFIALSSCGQPGSNAVL
jgi:hypothetical protein